MKNYCLLMMLCIGIFTSDVQAQNLIPNPSFETISEISIRWSGTFSFFNRRMMAWYSPTQGSPDILHTSVKDKMMPVRDGFNLRRNTPRTGEVMIGLKTYGCDASVLHCREYLAIALDHPLQEGREYEVIFYVNPMPQSIMAGNIGVSFTTKKVEQVFEIGLYDLAPVVNHEALIDNSPGDWLKVSGTFRADSAYQHMIIGNFFEDAATPARTDGSLINYSFLLIDDVSLQPVGDSEAITVGSIIRFNNIEFEFDDSQLKQESRGELSPVLNYLQENEQIKINISGHTDAAGATDYNQTLSEKRARAVAQYLISQGIKTGRITTAGFGESLPLTTNDTDAGRKLNRRVEIEILKD